MKFSEFIGNERITGYFKRAISRERLGHAFLFSGPGGLGKLTLARLVCKSLSCRNPSADGPCETCVPCHKFESGNHPDFHPFAPEGLYFKIDQVREMIHIAGLKPVESRWKAFLLEGVEYMREEGANAFLKVLEEPPGQTIFFLLTESSESLLPTVRSRCQQFAFQPIPPQQIQRWLIDRMGLSEAEALARASYAHGSLGRALVLNAQQYREMRDKVLIALEATLLPKSYFHLLDATKAITVERTEMSERFLILEELVRDLLILQSNGNAGLVHAEIGEKLTPLASRISPATLQALYERVLLAREAVLKMNANISLALQAIFLPVKTELELIH